MSIYILNTLQAYPQQVPSEWISEPLSDTGMPNQHGRSGLLQNEAAAHSLDHPDQKASPGSKQVGTFAAIFCTGDGSTHIKYKDGMEAFVFDPPNCNRKFAGMTPVLAT